MKKLILSAEDLSNLRRKFSGLKEITPFSEDPKFSALIAAIGIMKEIGTVNDELARFIFNKKTNQVVARESLQADLVEWNGFRGLKIFSSESDTLEIRAHGFCDLVHPDYSYNEQGDLKALYIFPEIISLIAAREGVELVMVKSWGMNSIFGGFDHSKGYYQTNFWELENNDSLLFSQLVKNGQLAFLGTHDLIAHISGLNSEKWTALQTQAKKVYQTITKYFSTTEKPTIAALILPYTIGVILDDLAQPPTYGSKSHEAVLDQLLIELDRESIPASLPSLLREFPQSFQKIIQISRDTQMASNPDAIKFAISSFIREILTQSLVAAG